MVFMSKSLWTMCVLVALSYQPVQAMEESEKQQRKFTGSKINPSLQSSMKVVTQEDLFSKDLRDINTLLLKEVFYNKDEKEGFAKTYWNLSLVTKDSYYLVKEYGPKWILEVCGIKKITPQAEDVFRRLFKGKLIYKPNRRSTEGQVTLYISSLPNPLGGEFDLSNCGNIGQDLSINMGYRKVETPANAKKLEIWITPRFLVDDELPQLAENHHIRKIEGNWDAVTAQKIYQ